MMNKKELRKKIEKDWNYYLSYVEEKGVYDGDFRYIEYNDVKKYIEDEKLVEFIKDELEKRYLEDLHRNPGGREIEANLSEVFSDIYHITKENEKFYEALRKEYKENVASALKTKDLTTLLQNEHIFQVNSDYKRKSYYIDWSNDSEIWKYIGDEIELLSRRLEWSLPDEEGERYVKYIEKAYELNNEKYLAKNPKYLFELIEMAADLKVTKDNYKVTVEQMKQVEELLDSTLNKFGNNCQEAFNKGKMSKKQFDEFIDLFKYYKKDVIPFMAENWAAKELEKQQIKAQIAENRFNAKNRAARISAIKENVKKAIKAPFKAVKKLANNVKEAYTDNKAKRQERKTMPEAEQRKIREEYSAKRMEELKKDL